MADYEKVRQARIEENRLKMKDLGVKSMAYEISMSRKRSKLTKNSNKVAKNIDKYTPDEEGELNYSSEEGENEMRKIGVNLRSRSKKVLALRGKSSTNIQDTTNVSSIRMADQVTMRHPNNKKQQLEQGMQGRDSMQRKNQPGLEQSKRNVSSSISQNSARLGMSTASRKLSFGSQQDKEVEVDAGVQTKKGKSKAMVAPGTLSAFLQMNRREKQSDLLLRQGQRQPVYMASSQPSEFEMAGSQRLSSRAQSYSQPQRFEPDLEEEDVDHMSSSEFNLEQHVDEEEEFSDGLHIPNGEIPDMKDETLMNEEHESEQIAPSKRKRTRGPTMCKDVHEWTLEERTLARNSYLAPLNKPNWHRVPDKENIWSYVKKKYIIKEEGKEQTLSSVGRLWRKYKCSVKAKHFTPYDNDRDRWKNSPKTIPATHFEELLEFWNLDEVQADSKKKREISTNQKDRHTMGPVSFARKQYKMQQQDVEKKPPSLALVYKESRKRKEDKIYKTSYEPTQNNILSFICLV